MALTLTPTLQKDVCDLVRLGVAPREAAAAKGIDSETFGEWMTNGRLGGRGRGRYTAFVRALEEAEAIAEATMIGRVQRAASDGVWQAAAWLAERRFPGRWTRKSVQEDLKVHGPRTTRGMEDPFAELDNVSSIDSARRRGAKASKEPNEVDEVLERLGEDE
jgi:hypothetical protein